MVTYFFHSESQKSLAQKTYTVNIFLDLFFAAMPTVRTKPRKQSYPFHYKVLERSIMKQKKDLVYASNVILLLKSMKQVSKNLIFIRLMTLLYSRVMHDEIWRKKSSCLRPLDCSKSVLNFFSPCWNEPDGDETFSVPLPIQTRAFWRFHVAVALFR